MVNIAFTIKILVIVIIAYLAINAWDKVIDKMLIKYFNLDENAISTWVAIAVVSIIVLLVIVVWTKVELHDLFGVSETVDTQFTGRVETIKRGKVIHSQSS